MRSTRISIYIVTLLTLFLAAASAAEEDRRPSMIIELNQDFSGALPSAAASDAGTLIQNLGLTNISVRSEIPLDRKIKGESIELDARQIRRFGRWLRIEGDSREELEKAANLLKLLGVARSSYHAPTVSPAGGFEDISAPLAELPSDFTDQQGYLLNAPLGIDAYYAWAMLNKKGRDVIFADMEGSWNRNHNDLPIRRNRIFGLMMAKNSAWFAHGTAVLGIVKGKENGEGVTGIAPKAKVRLMSIFRKEDNRIYDTVAESIFWAAEMLPPGSVLLIEVQYGDVAGVPSFVPVEYFTPEFEAIQHAVSKGIVVVEAAANGGLSFDEYMPPENQASDSGAIIVGAGGVPNRFNPAGRGFNLKRLSFSNYGSRVDVQNWGRYVVSAGYGDLHEKPSRYNNDYTSAFNGTSSASAITAGACILLQQFALQELGRPLISQEMRSILRETGTPQRGAVGGFRIGPRPDLKRAFEKVLSMVE